MISLTYALFAYVSLLAPLVYSGTTADVDPCLAANHRNVSHLYERYTDLRGACPYTDDEIVNAWYYAGEDSLVTFAPDLCSCGYKFPLWMNGTLPTPSDGVVTRVVCVRFIEECHQELNIQVKNCQGYFVYFLTPGPRDSGYCFGIIKPHPGHHSGSLPSVHVTVNETTAYSFSTLINTSNTEYNLTAELTLKDGGSTGRSVQINDTSFVYKWDNLTPDTHYSVMVYATVQGEKKVLAKTLISTDRFREPTATITVDTATITSEGMTILITFEHGSKPGTANGRLLLQNGSVITSFVINKHHLAHTFQNLEPGTLYLFEVYIIRQDKQVNLCKVNMFTKPEVQTYTQSVESMMKQIAFRCKFQSFPGYVYTVTWFIQRPERNFTIDRTMDDENSNLDLFEADLLKMHISLPFNISCFVSFERYSTASNILSAGMKVLNENIVMHREEIRNISFIPTIPIGCYRQTRGEILTCHLTVLLSIPVDGDCTGISTRKCSLQIHGNDSADSFFEIQSTEDGQYGLLKQTTYNVVLRTDSLQDSIWSKYIFPPVKVTVLPEQDTYWRGKRCDALNDPHMYTFDGMHYEHHESLSDEYVLYYHHIFNAKVHHKLERCNSRAMCNCGVAVQAGRDVYIVSTCNNKLEIGYRQCDDGVILVKQETDTKYTIYLPYGTYVTVRIDRTPYRNSVGSMIVSVSVYPSVHDQRAHSQGLCGTLDNNRDNDFHGRNGELNITRMQFIHTWRVSKEESLFQPTFKSATPWNLPACSCSVTSVGFDTADTCHLGADRGCSKGKSVGEKTCKMAEKVDINTTEILPTLDLKTESIFSTSTTLTTEAGLIWNKSKARIFCKGYMEASRTFGLCSFIPFSDTQRAIETCTQDIVFSQSTVWNHLSLQSMQDACISEIQRNQTVLERERSQTTTTTYYHQPSPTTPGGNQVHNATPSILIYQNILEVIDTIEQITCPNECSGNGQCINGECKCKAAFGLDDCSVDCAQPPVVAGLLHGNTCDRRYTECTHAFLYGGIFARESVMCHVITFEIYANKIGRRNTDIYIEAGQTQSVAEVICSLQSIRDKGLIQTVDDAMLVTCYRVSVSNDGIHHGAEHEICVYNSECQIIQYNKDGLLTAVIKQGYCFIDGKCIQSGVVQETDTDKSCDPKITLYGWSARLSSTIDPIHFTSEVVVTQVESKSSSLKTPIIAATSCICVIGAVVVLVVCIRKKKQRKSESGKKDMKDNFDVNYKHDANDEEETYAHINHIEVNDELPYMKGLKHDYVGDYTSLDPAFKAKSHYARLHSADSSRGERGPRLPERSQESRSPTVSQSNPYAKLNPSSRSEMHYERLQRSQSDQHYITSIDRNTKEHRGSEIRNGYELPVKRY